jgi:hypothetical protein
MAPRTSSCRRWNSCNAEAPWYRLGLPSRLVNPACNCFSGLLRDLELNRALGFLLHHDGTGSDALTVADVTHA